MADIFISFIHEEVRVAEAVQRFLQAHLGKNSGVFLSADQWQVYAGEQWLDRIIAELRDAKVVISLFSPTSVKRPWVNFEAGAAWVRPETKLIPVCFGGMSKGNMPKPYSSIQAIQLEDFSDQYYLVTSTLHHLNKIPPPPLPPLSESDDDEVGVWGAQIEEAREPYRKLRDALKRHNDDRKPMTPPPA
jgi:hypothetical protein